MGDASEKIPVQPSISSREHEELLNIIDTIRSQGISRYLDIPQIVVCGDQSSGKSSTLEAICGLRFPTSDGLCTRFATEYILRRDTQNSVHISIVPDTERSDAEIATLLAFKPSKTDLEEFTTISKEAADAMGIDKGGKTFSLDVLRIEICGPNQPHLTLVDLPGLFHAGIDRKGDENVEAVNSLVTSYIEKPRSIILAVVSAKNDLNLQKVIKFIRDHDPEGNRTLGVITKPDTLPANSPSEAQYLKVAQNSEVPYTLGWHVVKNRSFEEQDWSAMRRDADENKWLSKGIWNALHARQKGVGALRTRLSKVLQNHILAELPSLLKDVNVGVADCEHRLQALGASRGTMEEQRRYLLRASEKFARLMSAAIDGNYTDGFFESSGTDEGFQKRLRAVAVTILKNFAKEMRVNGHSVELVPNMPIRYVSRPGAPEKVTKEDFYQKVQFRMERNSGRELPGLFNPDIIGDLFLDHSEPWKNILTSTRDDLLEAAHTTIGHILDYAADETTIGGILREIVNPGMEPLEQALSVKAEEVLKPHMKGHPQTYNHYFIDNIQEKRQQESRKDMTERIKQFFSRDPESDTPSSRSWTGTLDVKTLLDTFLKPNEVNMDRFAAIEAVNAMLAYYKVGLKNVVDAFTMYAVEECLLSRMSTIFTPESVYTLDDKTITRIAGESEQSIAERESLSKKLAVLKDTQKILHRMDRHKPSVVEPEARLFIGSVDELFELQSVYEDLNGSSQPEYIESVSGEEEVLDQNDSDQPEIDYQHEEPNVADEQMSESFEASSEPLKNGRVTAAIERFEKVFLHKGHLRSSIRATTELTIETFTTILESLHDLPLFARKRTRKLLIRVKAYASTIDDYVPGFISMERFDRMLGRLPVIGAAYLDWTVWREEVLNCAFHVADLLLHNRAFRG